MNTYPICDSPPRRGAVQLCSVAEIAPKSSSLAVNRSWGFVPFFGIKNSRTFKDTFPIFQGFLSAKESLESVFFGSFTTWAILSWRSFCVCSLYALENLSWIKLAPKFKDFPVPTAILRTFKALNFYFKIQGLSRCVTGSRGVWCE